MGEMRKVVLASRNKDKVRELKQVFEGMPFEVVSSGDYPDGQFLRLYRQLPDHTFEEVTSIAGFDWEGCGGLSLGDFDRDGDVDVLVGRSFLRLNQAHRDEPMGGRQAHGVGAILSRTEQVRHD